MNIIKSIGHFMLFILFAIFNLITIVSYTLFNYLFLTTVIVGFFSFCAWDIRFLLEAYQFWTPTSNNNLILFRMLCWLASIAWAYALSNIRIGIGVMSNEDKSTESDSKH